jgi:hypothetical protein
MKRKESSTDCEAMRTTVTEKAPETENVSPG